MARARESWGGVLAVAVLAVAVRWHTAQALLGEVEFSHDSGVCFTSSERSFARNINTLTINDFLLDNLN